MEQQGALHAEKGGLQAELLGCRQQLFELERELKVRRAGGGTTLGAW